MNEWFIDLMNGWLHFPTEMKTHITRMTDWLNRSSRKKSFPFRDGFQAKKNRHRQFFAHTVFKFIFTTLIFYIVYDQSQARTILFCWIVLIFLVPGSLRAFPRISDFFDLHYLDFWKLIPRVWYIFCKERNSECIYVPVNMLGRP